MHRFWGDPTDVSANKGALPQIVRLHMPRDENAVAEIQDLLLLQMQNFHNEHGRTGESLPSGPLVDSVAGTAPSTAATLHALVLSVRQIQPALERLELVPHQLGGGEWGGSASRATWPVAPVIQHGTVITRVAGAMSASLSWAAGNVATGIASAREAIAHAAV